MLRHELIVTGCLALAVLSAEPTWAADNSARDLSGLWWSGANATPRPLELVGQRPALTAAGEAKFRETSAAKRAIDTAGTDPQKIEKCVPAGVPRIWAQPFPFEIVHEPGVTTIIYEHMHSWRFVYMNEPPVTVEEAIALNRMGSSVGRWDGDTLIIESTAFNAAGFLDETGLPLTENLKVIERLRKRDANTLEVVATVEDPEYYQRPWTVRTTFTRSNGTAFADYVCGLGAFETRYTQ